MPQVIIGMEEWQELSSRPTREYVESLTVHGNLEVAIRKSHGVGCLYDKPRTVWYCDECPVVKVEDHLESVGSPMRICHKSKDFSK